MLRALKFETALKTTVFSMTITLEFQKKICGALSYRLVSRKLDYQNVTLRRQVFNRFVTESEIRKALDDDIMERGQSLEDVSGLKLEEFRRLYFK